MGNNQAVADEPFKQQSWLPEDIAGLQEEIADSPEDLAALQFLLNVRQESQGGNQVYKSAHYD